MSDPFTGLPNEEVGKKLDQILEEVSTYSVDIEEDPTLPELGTKYLQRVLSQCRNFTNRVTFYLQAVMRLDKALKSEIRYSELDLDFKLRGLLADDMQVRQGSSIEDRKAVAGTMLKDEHTALDALRVRLVDVEETVKILKLKHGELLRTSQDIKLQRSIVRDDKMSQLGGDEGYSNPQINQDRSVPAGMTSPITSDNLNPIDLIKGAPDPEPLPKPIDSIHARQIADFLSSPDVRSKKLCSVCGEPQSMTPSGACCVNGHGGADPLEDGVKFSAPKIKEPDEPIVQMISYDDLLD